MTSLETMLGSLLGAPALPGAKCRGRSATFDPARPREPEDAVAQRHLQALLLCDTCPARLPCEQWLNSLTPARRPSGVVAGRIVRPAKPRQRKAQNR